MVDDPSEFEFLARESLSLNYKQKGIYAQERKTLIEFLRQEAKNPKRGIGLAESNIRPVARRIHQVHEYTWERDNVVYQLNEKHADQFIDALKDDDIRKKNGDEYKEGSKRKFANSLETYFDYLGVNWGPDINFSQSTNISADPLNRSEREQLLNAAMEYQSPPSYKNVSPEERDRWNAQLAQYLEKPKDKIGPDDWKRRRRNWKIPSLISVSLDIGPRAELVGRLTTQVPNLETGQLIIPADMAVKNNKNWKSELSPRSVKMLEKWLKQRENIKKYDNSNKIWLNRKGNPYNSKNLNNLLDNLMQKAGVKQDGRTLVWHSIRHSTGMYIYNQEKDLALVAEILRQKSLESARQYAHPTPETKESVVESIQRGMINDV